MLHVTWLGASPTYDPSNSFARTERELEARLPPDVRVHKVPWGVKELFRVGPIGVGGIVSKYTQMARRDLPVGVPHLMTQEMAFLLRLRRYREGVITVYDLHALLGATDSRSRLAWTVDNAMNRAGFRHARRVVCISEHTAKTVVEHLRVPEERVRVAYVGVGPEYRVLPGLDRAAVLARHGVPADAKALLYVGSEHPRKNLPTLMRAMGLAKERTRVPFVLLKVGNEVFRGGRQLTLDAARAAGVEKDVLFLGRLSNEEVAELYNAVDATVMPSTFEGFGLPVAEAMASGSPVVCSNATSLAEVAGDAALTHDPLDADALARHLVDVLEHGRRDLVPRALQRATRYDWQRYADVHLECYREAAAAIAR